MEYVSTAYKAGMASLARNKSYMSVSMGLINQSAQQNTMVENNGNYTYYTNFKGPFNSVLVEKLYASYEQNYTSLDGTMYFLPRENSDKSYYNAGIVTNQEVDSYTEIDIKFDLLDPVDIKGLTIDFGKSYPTKFIIEIDEEQIEFENDVEIFSTETVFYNVTFMKIIPEVMKNEHARLRIHEITFGIGIVFDDTKIVDATLKTSISPIGINLQTIDFTVTIENMDRYYNVDNEDSAINFLETGQEIEVYYGLQLEDESVEWIKAATLQAQEWSANDTEAEFSAVDKFEYMQDYYKNGEYIENGITLYNLASDVFLDAGMDSDEYWIDPYLDNITVYNPLPILTHKECLQLIASAGRCVLMQNRDGAIILKSSFIPDVAVESNQFNWYGDIDEVLEDETSYEYATYEQLFSKVNRTQYFIPRDENFLQTGYISVSLSDENGDFTENPIITLSLESAYCFYNIIFTFGGVYPEEFIMRTYNGDIQKTTYASKDITTRTIVSYDFLDIDKIEIEFTKTKPFNRIHLQRIEFGEATDYELTYNDLLETPSGTKTEKVKELQIVRTIYTKGTVKKDLLQEEIDLIGEAVEYEYEFTNAVHNLTVEVTVDDETLTCGAEIIESKSYWCKVKISNPPIQQGAMLTIKGYEYEISTETKSYKLNNSGKIQTWDNPLISTEEDANNLGEWIGDYYAVGNQYEFTFRGDPAIDANDLIYLESRYVDELMICVEEIQTTYSGAISGSMIARRCVL